jgi:hypothetical protein
MGRPSTLGLAVAFATLLLTLALSAAPASAVDPSRCGFTAYPAPPAEGLPRHNVQFYLSCKEDFGESRDLAFGRITVTTNQTLQAPGGWGYSRGRCSMTSSTLECGIGDGASAPVLAHGIIEYQQPLACGGGGLGALEPTTVSAVVTIVNQDDATVQTFHLDSANGPCAGVLSLSGVPKRCVKKNFTVKLGVPESLRQLLKEARGGDTDEEDASVRVLRRGRELVTKSPPIGKLVDGETFTIPAKSLKSGKYQLATLVGGYDPSDYPSASAQFKRC